MKSSTAPTLCIIEGTATGVALDRLQREPNLTVVTEGEATVEQRRIAEVLLAWDFRWRSIESVLPLMPALRWIHAASAGVDHVLVPEVLERDLLVSNSAGVFERPIAEYVLGLVIAHAKGFLVTARAHDERRWAYRETSAIAGATMVVVGAGRVGLAVGHLARAAGLQVIGVRRSPTGDRLGLDSVVGTADLTAVAAKADYLVVTLALTDQTRGLVGAGVIDALPASAYVINVGRSPVLDASALVAALSSGRIAGAILDVFDDEPLPSDSPLWAVPNLLISPHMSADTDGWDSRVVDVFVDNLASYRAGLELVTRVDTARGY